MGSQHVHSQSPENTVERPPHMPAPQGVGLPHLHTQLSPSSRRPSPLSARFIPSFRSQLSHSPGPFFPLSLSGAVTWQPSPSPHVVIPSTEALRLPPQDRKAFQWEGLFVHHPMPTVGTCLAPRGPQWKEGVGWINELRLIGSGD